MGSVSVHGVSATHAAHECDFLDVRAIGPMHLVGTGVRRRWPPLKVRVCLRAGRPVGASVRFSLAVLQHTGVLPHGGRTPKLADPSRSDTHRPHHERGPSSVRMLGLLRRSVASVCSSACDDEVKPMRWRR